MERFEVRNEILNYVERTSPLLTIHSWLWMLTQLVKEMLEKSQGGIAKHTDILKEFIATNGEKTSKEHCKGMEGLVAEATKHVVEEGPKKGPLRDVVIIAQYQRMTHYGIAGFGTAAAYAKALGLKEDERKLKDATKEIYSGDEYMNRLAEGSVNLQAEAA